jgi:3-phenylpropionate/trans-cinnamate dioxygenase ferredoxin reductase subunit
MTSRRFVVVGGGVGGAAAVAELRSSGFDGQVVLIADEAVVPYVRPPLSKEMLLDADEADHPAFHPAGWYESQSVELLLSTRASELDLAARTLTLAGGRRLSYDGLILATGVRARRLPGIDGENVCYLRTVADAHALRARLVYAERVAVIGGGLLGCEVAAAAAVLGKEVTLLTAAPLPLERVLGSTIASVMAGVHRAEGVDVRGGQVVTEAVEQGGRVSVSTDQGVVECDLLVVAVGSVPNVELAQRAGLDVMDGVVVDEYCRTAAPNVYAVGDVASQLHPHYGRHLRVEHHDNAIRQGSCAARNLLGADDPFADAHWFWSDQYEHSLQSAGICEDREDLVIRGSIEELAFSAFSLKDGRVRSVIALNRPRDVLETRRLLFAAHDATAEQLRDESVPLRRLVRSNSRPVPARG